MWDNNVKIVFEDLQGTIGFSETEPGGRVKFEVTFPTSSIRRKISQYLGKTQVEFWTPESSQIDDYRVDNVLPVKNLDYFNRALCSLASKIGVWVTW